MELITAPPPTSPLRYAFFDDNFDFKNTTATTTTATTTTTTSLPCPSSPSHHLELRLPLRYPKHSTLPLHSSSHQPLQPLSPTENSHKKKQKTKKKKKRATTSHILHLMDALPFPIPIDIYTSLIKECTISGDPETAVELCNHVIHSGIKPPLSFLNRILVMLASCGLLDNARQVFDKMSHRDFNSWATLFVAYYDNSDYEEATRVFVIMLEQLGMSEYPPWIWVCLLKACACTVNIPLGMQVHGWLLKLGTSDHVLVSSSLISFYGRFKCIEDANAVFDRVSRHNTLTWTAKIVSGCRERNSSEAFRDFREMGRKGVKKDSFTFSSILKACGKMMDHEFGEQVHADTIKHGMVSDNYVQCSLIAMYGRSLLLRDAKKVFEMNKNERNVDCWNAMLMSYIHNDLYIEAVKFLYQMKEARMQPQESLVNRIRNGSGSVNHSNMN